MPSVAWCTTKAMHFTVLLTVVGWVRVEQFEIHHLRKNFRFAHPSNSVHLLGLEISSICLLLRLLNLHSLFSFCRLTHTAKLRCIDRGVILVDQRSQFLRNFSLVKVVNLASIIYKGEILINKVTKWCWGEIRNLISCLIFDFAWLIRPYF